MDQIDRVLLAELQRDAAQPYAVLGQTVGLSAGAAHERVRKLRERGVIRRTMADVDPAAVGGPVLAYVMVESTAWMGDSAQHFGELPEILEAHVIAGSASVLLKVRTATTGRLQDVLRRVYAIDGVSRTQVLVVLDTFFERQFSPVGADQVILDSPDRSPAAKLSETAEDGGE